ncbi:AEC family transporter [Anaerobacillus sp. CMMVII]|uniref:AEC family transporter n=1 Tax=Anaerobacillus sp. CMMVII TaxID=2755588 RepID=UPI0021B82599|nr:AEC family transporter [Anaerobacillus sp. CMMVII]
MSDNQFIYIIAIITLGYLLKRFHVLKETDGEALSRIIFNFTLPALIIYSFNGFEFEYSLVLLILIAFVYGIFSAILAFLIFKKETRRIKGMLVMMVPGFNIGLFAYPLVEAIWGHKGLVYFGMFDIGNAFVVFGVTYLIASFYASDDEKLDYKRVFVKISRSIPLLTYTVACLLSILGIGLPNLIINVTEIVSKAKHAFIAATIRYVFEFFI